MSLKIVIDNHYKGLNPILLGHAQCKPSHRYGPAVRTHWLLHYIVSGYGQFTREGQTYQLSPGQIFVIPPYVETVYEADAEKPWKYIWIGFTTDDIPSVFLSPVITCPKASHIFSKMLENYNSGKGYSAFLSSCLWELVSILLNENDYEPTHIKKARHFLDSNYTNPISVQDVADALNLHRSYLTTIFKKYLHISPQEYLVRLRLDKASELLLFTNMQISTIANSVGYEDIYHFSKSFKKRFGCSPRDWRKNQQNIS